jgi:O-antigen/teichoic acid export membrane protein
MIRQQLGRLAKNTLTYGVGQVLNRFISFLLLPVFTSYLTPADYGIMSILGLVAFVVTPVFSLGLGAATGICYFEDNNPERKKTTIWTAFAILVASMSILALLGIAFARQISRAAFLTTDYSYLVTISLLSTCLGILVIPFMLYLQFEEKAKTFVALTAISTLISIGLSIVMVVVLRKGVPGLVEGQLIAQGIGLALYMLLVAPRLGFRFSRSLARELLRLGVPLIPAFASLFVLQQMNKYILQWFDGLEAVGIYAIGFNMGLLMNLFVTGFTNAWYPYFMSFMDKQAEARVLFGRILTYYVLGFGALSLLFYLAAKPVVMIMTQPAFHQAYKVVGLSATAQFLTGVFSLLLPGMYFAKQVKYQSIVQVAAASIAIGLNLVLIPWLGFLGAAIALALGHLAMTMLQQAWNLRRTHAYLEVQYEWNRILGFLLIYTGYAVLMLWERNFSLLIEVAFSCIVAAPLPVMFYFLLTTSEKRTLWTMGKQFILELADRVSLNI